jgi:hypothetical protein
MDIKEFAQTLDNRQYDYPQFTKEELQIAKDNGFVIVCGASDDLMEFYGALEDEGDCFEGGKVYFDQYGVFQDGTKCDSVIEAFWCDEYFKDENGNVITWTYKTDIPHETFMIYEDEEPYCRGIVFKLEDIK